MATVIDLAVALVTLGVAYAVFSEGFLGAVLMFANVVFAGLIAFNFYEPLAKLLVDNIPKEIAGFADVTCLMVLFLVPLLILRFTTDAIAPKLIRFPKLVELLGRLVFAALCAGVTVGFL